jgi:hypothetical protein
MGVLYRPDSVGAIAFGAGIAWILVHPDTDIGMAFFIVAIGGESPAAKEIA